MGDRSETRIAPAPFDVADERPINAGVFRELFLRHFQSFAPGGNHFAEAIVEVLMMGMFVSHSRACRGVISERHLATISLALGSDVDECLQHSRG